MAEYIDREETIKIVVETAVEIFDCHTTVPLLKFANKIRTIPTADVVKVKHGEWLKTDAYPHRIFCSLCYKTYVTNEEVIQGRSFNRPAYCTEAEYCPHCGAKMDLKEGEEE